MVTALYWMSMYWGNTNLLLYIGSVSPEDIRRDPKCIPTMLGSHPGKTESTKLVLSFISEVG